MNRSQTAIDLFNSGYNCAQSIVGAFSDVLGLSLTQAVKLASSFGGGLSRMREVCGTVSGMAIIIGILYGYSEPTDFNGKKWQYSLVQSLANEFKNQYGTVNCRELLGELGKDSTPDPTPRTPEYYCKRPCGRFIYTMAEIVDRCIAENPPQSINFLHPPEK